MSGCVGVGVAVGDGVSVGVLEGRGDGVVVGIGVFVGARLWVGTGVGDAAAGRLVASFEMAIALVGNAARTPELAGWDWLQALRISRCNSKKDQGAMDR